MIDAWARLYVRAADDERIDRVFREIIAMTCEDTHVHLVETGRAETMEVSE